MWGRNWSTWCWLFTSGAHLLKIICSAMRSLLRTTFYVQYSATALDVTHANNNTTHIWQRWKVPDFPRLILRMLAQRLCQFNRCHGLMACISTSRWSSPLPCAPKSEDPGPHLVEETVGSCVEFEHAVRPESVNRYLMTELSSTL